MDNWIQSSMGSGGRQTASPGCVNDRCRENETPWLHQQGRETGRQSRKMRAQLSGEETRIAMQQPVDHRPDGEPPRRVTRSTWFFIVLAAVSAGGLALRDGGAELVDALTHAAVLLLSIAPVIGAALLLGGYVHALLPHERVARWLGPGSGLGGYGIALLGGIVTPAGPFAVFPILLALRQAGAGFPVCVVYITAWATLGLQRLVIWELPFLGFDFVALRLAASLPLPILAGLLAAAVARRVSR